jgi:hypothetical protein
MSLRWCYFRPAPFANFTQRRNLDRPFVFNELALDEAENLAATSIMGDATYV